MAVRRLGKCSFVPRGWSCSAPRQSWEHPILNEKTDTVGVPLNSFGRNHLIHYKRPTLLFLSFVVWYLKMYYVERSSSLRSHSKSRPLDSVVFQSYS